MEELTKSLNNALNSFYAVETNKDGTFTVWTEYNIELIKFVPSSKYSNAKITWLQTTRNLR